MQRQGMRLANSAQNRLNTYQQAANRELAAISNNADQLVDSALQKAGDYAKGTYTTGKSKLRMWWDSPLASKAKHAGKTILKYGLPIAAAAVGAHYLGKKQGINSMAQRAAQAESANKLSRQQLQETREQAAAEKQKAEADRADLIQRSNEFHEKQYDQVWNELQAQKQRNDALLNEGQRIINDLQTQLMQSQHENPQLKQALDIALQQQQAALQQQQVLQQKVNTLKSAIKFKEAEITAGINAQATTALNKQAKTANTKIAGLKLSQQIQNAAQTAQAQDAIGKASQDAQMALEQANYELQLQQGATSQLLQENKQLWDHALKDHKAASLYNQPDSLTAGIRETQPFHVTFEANRLNQQNNSLPDQQYPMHKQQPIRVGIAPVTTHKIAFKGKRQKEPEVRRGTRILTTTGLQKLQRAIIAKKVRESNVMQDDGPLQREKRSLNETPAPGKKKKGGRGWADAARAFAPFMQTGFKVYQNHQYNEAARQKREMLAERLGVSPHDLEGLSSRGLLE